MSRSTPEDNDRTNRSRSNTTPCHCEKRSDEANSVGLSAHRSTAFAEKSLPQILTSWDRLQRLLRETIDEAHYHLGHTFERVEQDGSGVVVHFAGGRSERADLLIGGDGIRSSVRAQVAPAVKPIYSGYYIWRGAPNEADLTPETRTSIFPYFAFFLPEQQQIMGYPIAGLNNDLRPGHRRYNFIGTASAMRKNYARCASTGTGASTNIPCRHRSSART